MNQMLHCGENYNNSVQTALECLPPDVFDELSSSLAIISTTGSDGCRLARATCEQKEIILLSERIFPRRGMSEGDAVVRYFTFVVLHEVAHAYRKHRSPMFDNITPEENQAQEAEADDLALRWYNAYIRKRANPHLTELTAEEVENAKNKSREEREARYAGSN